MLPSETIAAISTAAGEGGIGIVRISGPKAFEISNRILHFKNGIRTSERQSHTIALASIIDDRDSVEIDEALVSIMKAPNTYTCEDIVEINCHGSNVSLKKTLQLILRAGAKLAEPGEFTRRAFLNGRIDLAQAEAVIDIIKSRTEAGLKAAVRQLEGSLSDEISKIISKVSDALVQIEASIDFSDEDLDLLPKDKIINILKSAEIACDELLRTSIRGRMLKEGVRTTIVGRPNVGKSSVLNAMVRMEKAIVTDVPGTTRDIIEETININGVPLILEDTAGLRNTNDQVEKIGVDLAIKAMERSDIVLCVIDGSTNLTDEDIDIINKNKNKNSILIINKSDLKLRSTVKNLGMPEGFCGSIEVSALTGDGIKELELLIGKKIFEKEMNSADTLITNVRHEQLLTDARRNIGEASNLIEQDQPEEVIALIIREALNLLREITGEAVSEDILEKIFSRFCIGK